MKGKICNVSPVVHTSVSSLTMPVSTATIYDPQIGLFSHSAVVRISHEIIPNGGNNPTRIYFVGNDNALHELGGADIMSTTYQDNKLPIGSWTVSANSPVAAVGFLSNGLGTFMLRVYFVDTANTLHEMCWTEGQNEWVQGHTFTKTPVYNSPVLYAAYDDFGTTCIRVGYLIFDSTGTKLQLHESYYDFAEQNMVRLDGVMPHLNGQLSNSRQTQYRLSA